MANKMRATALLMIHAGRSAHAGSNMSPADIYTILYNAIAKINPKRPNDPNRDRVVISKGHGAAIVWAILAERGFFPRQWLKTYYKDNGKLPGHITKMQIPGVELSTGSLGHGLPFSCGVALSGKRNHKKFRVFTILSDGEMDEGSNWEAFLFAPHYKLDNLTVILDYNKIQSLARVSETLNLEPLREKLISFGWAVKEIDGHNHKQIFETLKKIPLNKNKPSFIIAHTIKGKGVSFMEDTVTWHYGNTTDAQIKQALKELGMQNLRI